MKHRIHATAIVFERKGILIRGASGSGKSMLALELLRQAEDAGLKAALVADDQVDLRSRSENLQALTIPGFEGKIECRGVGILNVPYQSETTIDLIADLTDVQSIERLPDAVNQIDVFEGIEVRKIDIPKRSITVSALMIRNIL